MELNFDAIASAALSQASTLLPNWLPGGIWEGDEYIARNPTRADRKLGSFKINRNTGLASDFATNWRGKDLIALRAMLDSCSQSEAARKLAAELGLEAEAAPDRAAKPKHKGSDDWTPITPVPEDAPPAPTRHFRYGELSQRWNYQDAEGKLLFHVCRFDVVKDGMPGKEVLPQSYCQHRDGRKEWRWKGLPAPRPLYNLHLLYHYPEALVVVVEGEKAADAAAQLLPLSDYVITTSPGGANSAKQADWKPLFGRKVFLWPDADAAGNDYAEAVSSQLAGKATVRLLDLSIFGDVPEGWDAADALEVGKNAEDIQRIVKEAMQAAPASDAQPKPRSSSPYRLIEGRGGLGGGVYFYGEEGDPPLWICSPLVIEARTHNGEGKSWGYLLNWCDPDGRAHRWAMPAEMLAGQGDEYRRELLDGGLQIAPGAKAKGHLTNYLQTARVEVRARCTDRIGWHDGVFVLPSGTLGESREEVIYQAGVIVKHAFQQRGTMEEWRERVALPCSGNSRAVFALACAFAPPLLEAAGEDSGGFHFRGSSSTGKTTLLKLAASVWGGPDYLQRWRATANGLEGIAQLHNDGLLILDELAQMEPRDAGVVAYMLANGSGKIRASREGLARRPCRWRLLYLSAGEIGLAEHMRAGGQEAKAGQEIRLADIQADVGKGMGAFEQLHGCADSASFARMLGEAAAKQYGTAGIAFLEYLIPNLATLPTVIESERKRIMTQIVPHGASGQVERVAARFALVAVAGELASHLGITGWEAGEVERAVASCFHAWLEARGGAGNLETGKLLADIRAFLELHGESRFTPLDRKDDGKPTINRMGFARNGADGREYIVLPEAFRRELCKGHDARLAVKLLLERGILVPDSGGAPQRRENLPGMKRARCYVIRADKLGEDAHAEL